MLPRKMENAGIRGIASDFVNSYLTNRNQIVNTGDHISDPKKIVVVSHKAISLALLYFLYMLVTS